MKGYNNKLAEKNKESGKRERGRERKNQ